MNEEYYRSILIGSSENVIECDEHSQRHLSSHYTAIKGHSYALVKKHQQNSIVWQRSGENKCNLLQRHYRLYNWKSLRSRKNKETLSALKLARLKKIVDFGKQDEITT